MLMRKHLDYQEANTAVNDNETSENNEIIWNEATKIYDLLTQRATNL